MTDHNSETKPKVVFIVSQPHAGSTLLQTMLGGHPRVTAPGETWMMFPLADAISGAPRAVESPNDGYLVNNGINVFAQQHLGGGISSLQKEIGLAAARIYQNACQQANADVFVDKTPRYYCIIEDILRILPDSRIILLVRNPIAILSSVIQAWSRKGSGGSLVSLRADLLEAPACLAKAIESGDNRVRQLRYEQLVTDTENVLLELQSFLGLDVVENLASRRQGTHAHQKSLEKWFRHAATSALAWRLMDDYCRFLGPELLTRLGYDPRLIADKLQDVRPPGTAIAPSLATMLNRQPINPLRSILLLRTLAANAVSRVTRSAA